MTFNDYIKSIFNNEEEIYEVRSEEFIDFTNIYNDGKRQVVTKSLGGNVYQTCVLNNYQIIVLTNELDDTMKELTKLTWQYNENYYKGDEFQQVKVLFTAPLAINNFQQTGSGYESAIQISATLIKTNAVSDIEYVTINGNIIETITREMNYSTEPDSQRYGSSAKINTTAINRAVSQLTIQLINKDDDLCNEIVKGLFFGTVDINTEYTVGFKFYDDDTIYYLTMKVSGDHLSSQRGALPSNTITFIH